MVRRDDDLPVHEPRRTDVDPRAARRAERQVSLLFVVGILTPIVFWLEYVYIPRDKVVTIPFIGATSASNFFLGLTMGIGLLCVGVGAIHWAKKLMPAVEESSERHPPRRRRRRQVHRDRRLRRGRRGQRLPQVQDDPAHADRRAGRHAAVRRAAAQGPRPDARRQAVPHDLAEGDPDRHRPDPQPAARPRTSRSAAWCPASRRTCPRSRRPAARRMRGPRRRWSWSACAPRRSRRSRARNWDYEGILCYSKICTHVGCPIALYEQQTHHAALPVPPVDVRPVRRRAR